MIQVTAALIVRDGRILIAKRPATDKLANKWEFPGGKIESRERPEECLAREIREEFGVTIKVEAYFGESIFHYDSGSVNLLVYWATLESGEPNAMEHDEIYWVLPSDLANFDFAPADVPVVQRLRSEHDAIFTPASPRRVSR